MASNNDDKFAKGLIFIYTPQDLRLKIAEYRNKDNIYKVKRLITTRYNYLSLYITSVKYVLEVIQVMLKNINKITSFQDQINNIINLTSSSIKTQVSTTNKIYIEEEKVSTKALLIISKTLSQIDLLNFIKYITTKFNLRQLSDSLVVGRIIGQSKPMLIHRQGGDIGKEIINILISLDLSCRSTNPFLKY